MMKVKKIFAIVAGLVFGVIFILYGTRELINSRRLATEGKSATARVTDADEWVSGRLRHHTYYLTVEFQPEGGAAEVSKKVTVSEEVFTAGQIKRSVKVHYLAEDPTICAAGETVELRFGTLLTGILALGTAVFLIVVFRQPANTEEAAEQIEDRLKRLKQACFEYAPADARDFKHLDLAFYDENRRHLEQQGYGYLADQENISLRNPGSARTFLRFLVNRDQTVIAVLYHFKRRGFPARESKVLDLESWFSNGSFVCTSNAEMAGKLDYPAAIDSFFLPANTPLDALLLAHERRVSNFLARNPGVSAIRINGMEDVRRAGDELQRIKAEFRSQTGISKAELERIAGKTGPQIDELHATLTERQARQRVGSA